MSVARRVRVGLEYFHPWPNSTGFHLASHARWYRDAGLDVELRVVDPLRGDSLGALVAGDVDFAVVPSGRLLVRRERGEPVLGIAAINHRAMETIQTLRRTGIGRPRDLAGRRVALNPTPRGVAMVRHLVAWDGGDPDQVTVFDSAVRELGADDIAAGTVDATFGGYWAWDALFGATPEEERVMWRIDEIGAPRHHSYLLATREDVIERDADDVRAFVSATERGYRAAIDDPERALAVLERVIAYFPAAVIERSLALVGATWLHEGRWGEQRDELIDSYARWLAAHRVLRGGEGWTNAITNDLLPGVVV